MASRSERAAKSAGESSPAVPDTASVVDELTGALAETDRAPTDPGGAVEALAQFSLPGTTPETPAPEKRGPGRPRKDATAPRASAPPRATAKPGRRTLRDRADEAEAEAAALRAQVAQLRPDAAAVAQCREALQGTFTIAGVLLATMIHPTLDISPQAEKLADLWAVPLSPHMEGISESMPYVAAALGTVVVLLPVYQNYTKAMAAPPADLVPLATPLPDDKPTPVEVGTHPTPHNFTRSMGVL